MKPCVHPPDQVTADILQGDWPEHQVLWCRQCGAFKIRVFDKNYLHPKPLQPGRKKYSRDAKNYVSPWNEPTFNIDPLCPTPELDGSFPVVLYFENKHEAAEFEAAVLAEKPNLKPKQL
jgi:hypothetical protein